MPKIRWRHIFFVLFGYPLLLQGQLQTNKYPVRFSQYYNCYSLINPAASGAYTNYDISVGDKHLLGNFSKVSTYYLSLNKRIALRNYRTNTSYSSLGVLFYNDREGKYLNRSRFYASYAWHGNISKKIKISAGFQMGAMNYSVKGTPLSGDGSDAAPDGNIGVWIYNHWFHMGISYNQIFNSKLQPLDEIAILSPYSNIDGNLALNISEQFSFSPSWSLRVPITDNIFYTDVTLNFCYKNKIAAIIGVHNNKQFVNSIEIRNILNGNSPLNLCLTYGYPYSKEGIQTNFIEFGIVFAK
jgi:type IX secretion system PorP/SprF family membrane protein